MDGTAWTTSISPAAAATIRDASANATPAINGTVRRTPKLAPEAAANTVLGPGVNVVATARTTMERSASTIVRAALPFFLARSTTTEDAAVQQNTAAAVQASGA